MMSNYVQLATIDPRRKLADGRISAFADVRLARSIRQQWSGNLPFSIEGARMTALSFVKRELPTRRGNYLFVKVSVQERLWCNRPAKTPWKYSRSELIPGSMSNCP
jgi:hypothetical protein